MNEQAHLHNTSCPEASCSPPEIFSGSAAGGLRDAAATETVERLPKQNKEINHWDVIIPPISHTVAAGLRPKSHFPISAPQ